LFIGESRNITEVTFVGEPMNVTEEHKPLTFVGELRNITKVTFVRELKNIRFVLKNSILPSFPLFTSEETEAWYYAFQQALFPLL
jgi:hypothetical protein